MEGNEDPPQKRKGKEIQMKENSNEPESKARKNNDGNPIRQSDSVYKENNNSSANSDNNTPNLFNYDIFADSQILYPEQHPGPFYVLLDSETPITSRRLNSELHLYEKLKKANIVANFLSKNVSYKSFRLTFNNFNSANNFVRNPNLKSIGLKAYIPDRFAQKFYVIKNVPKSFTGKMIIDEINNSDNMFDAVSVFRFNIKDDKGKYIPSETVKVGLISGNVVKEINMFNTKVKAELFIQSVRQCKNCGRLGHIAAHCRSKKRCLFCGQNIICPNNCYETKCDFCMSTVKCIEMCISPKCILCNKLDHTSSDSRVCRQYANEKEIKSIMALSNLSRKECLQTYPSNNYYAILDDPQYENDFPLYGNNARPVTKTVNEEINRRVTKIKYSKVAAMTPKRNLPKVDPIVITPSKPVFEYENFTKVSQVEKMLTYFTKQMTSVLKAANCTEGLSILEAFQREIKSVPSGSKNTQKIVENNSEYECSPT